MAENSGSIRKKQEQYIIHHGMRIDRECTQSNKSKYLGKSKEDCIVSLVCNILNFSFGRTWKRYQKDIARLFGFLCFPVVCLLRIVKVIKWRRLLDPWRWRRRLYKTFYQISTSVMEIVTTSSRDLSTEEWAHFRLTNHNRLRFFRFKKAYVDGISEIKEV